MKQKEKEINERIEAAQIIIDLQQITIDACKEELKLFKDQEKKKAIKEFTELLYSKNPKL